MNGTPTVSKGDLVARFVTDEATSKIADRGFQRARAWAKTSDSAQAAYPKAAYAKTSGGRRRFLHLEWASSVLLRVVKRLRRPALDP